MSTPVSFLYILPKELLIKVLWLTDPRDLVRCRQLCQAIKDCVDTSVALQYSIKLASVGYENGPANLGGAFPSSASRLERLSEHICAWDHLDWTVSRAEIPSAFGAYELVGGVLGIVEPPSTMMFIQLPSRIRDNPRRNWVHPAVGFHIERLSMDIAQNLLVLLELTELIGIDYTVPEAPYQGCLHIRTLDQNSSHPSATQPILNGFQTIKGHSHFQIVGDKLCLLCQGRVADPGTLYVWLWPTGDLILRLQLHSSVNSFCFINPSTIVLPNHRARGSLSEESIQTSLRIISLGDAQHPPRDLVYLDLPALRQGVGSILNIYSSPNSKSVHPAPFLASFEERTIMLAWFTQGGLHSAADLYGSPFSRTDRVFIHTRVLSLYTRQLGATLHIPWESWGPHHARFIDLRGSPNNFAAFIHGNRFVHFSSPGVIRVLDFSPGDPTEAAIDLRAHFRTTYVGRETQERILSPQIFENEVISTIPFRSIERPLAFPVPGHYSGSLMCDDEHILLFEVLDNETRDRLITLTL